jgi:hypothetical protein
MVQGMGFMQDEERKINPFIQEYNGFRCFLNDTTSSTIAGINEAVNDETTETGSRGQPTMNNHVRWECARGLITPQSKK